MSEGRSTFQATHAIRHHAGTAVDTTQGAVEMTSAQAVLVAKEGPWWYYYLFLVSRGCNQSHGELAIHKQHLVAS